MNYLNYRVVFVTGMLCFLCILVSGQEPVSRTAWGDPDLQGLWINDVVTPLERPQTIGVREVLTEEELAEAIEANERRQIDTGGPRPGDPILLSGYNHFWIGERQVSTQTSLVVDPPDGRIPSLTDEGEKWNALAFESSQGVGALDASLRRNTDGPEGRSLWERCLTRGLPRLPDFYNNNYLILQTPDHIAILMEMIHEVRVIPLDRSPHLSQNVRQWLGDSRGWWDGDTLVVETTNFSDKTNFKGARKNLRLVERFTRSEGGSLLYEVTVDDLTTWTSDWTVRMPLGVSSGDIFEYACHEGNYAMTNTLAGARAEEAEQR